MRVVEVRAKPLRWPLEPRGAARGTWSARCAVVVGVRDRFQRVAERMFSWVARARWSLRDPLCGMKGYRVEVYRALGHFDSYGSIGTELAIFAAARGYRIVEIPVRTRERVGVPRFGRLLLGNWRILRALLLSQVRVPRIARR